MQAIARESVGALRDREFMAESSTLDPLAPALARLHSILEEVSGIVSDLAPRTASLRALADEHAAIERGLQARGAANVTRESIAQVFGLGAGEQVTFDGESGAIFGARNFAANQLLALQQHVGKPVRVVSYSLSGVVVEWG